MMLMLVNRIGCFLYTIIRNDVSRCNNWEFKIKTKLQQRTAHPTPSIWQCTLSCTTELYGTQFTSPYYRQSFNFGPVFGRLECYVCLSYQPCFGKLFLTSANTVGRAENQLLPPPLKRKRKNYIWKVKRRAVFFCYLRYKR